MKCIKRITKVLSIGTLIAACISTGFAQKSNKSAEVANKGSITFIGKVAGDTKGYNKIYFYSSGSAVDSATIEDGKFQLVVPFSGTYTQLFYTQYETSANRGYRPFPILVVKPGTINIDMNIEKGFYSSTLSGNSDSELYNDFLIGQNGVYQAVNEDLEKLYGKSSGVINRGSPEASQRNVSRDSLIKIKMSELIKGFIRNKPDAFVSAYVLNNAKYSMDATNLASAYALLSKERQQSDLGQEASAFLQGLKNAQVGNMVSNFVLNDENDKSFNFQQLKGKYVWVDFWASWCGPCKKAFPLMQEIYAKYKGENFEILGISSDDTKEPWLKAVDEFKNPWPQVWDDKTVAAQFAVAAYPTSFLIGPDGKILLKEIGFEPGGELEKKLQEIFGR